jgi:thiamine biosynthesis lipoprotein ApbE
VFDPTVQPLWQLYFDHFVVAGAPQAPAPAAVAQALATGGLARRARAGHAVSLARPGMALTLNGVAQGFITDRCTDVLRAHGFDRMLVDMGEPRALAAKPDGTAWRIGLADPREPSRALRTLPVIDRAVATSGGYGTRLDDCRALHAPHQCPQRATAPAFRERHGDRPTALQADALSTALALMPAADVATRQALLNLHPGCRAVCIGAQGQMLDLEASRMNSASPLRLNSARPNSLDRRPGPRRGGGRQLCLAGHDWRPPPAAVAPAAAPAAPHTLPPTPVRPTQWRAPRTLPTTARRWPWVTPCAWAWTARH